MGLLLVPVGPPDQAVPQVTCQIRQVPLYCHSRHELRYSCPVQHNGALICIMYHTPLGSLYALSQNQAKIGNRVLQSLLELLQMFPCML